MGPPWLRTWSPLLVSRWSHALSLPIEAYLQSQPVDPGRGSEGDMTARTKWPQAAARTDSLQASERQLILMGWGSKGYLNLWEMGMGFEVRGQHWQGPGCWGCLLCIRRNSRCYCILPSRGRGILTWLLGYMTSSSGQIRGYREACRPGVGEQLTPANLRMRFPRFDPILAPDLFPQSHDFS